MAALSLSACSTPTSGNAQPSPTAVGTSSQTAPNSPGGQAPGQGAPKVANPIDVTSYLQAPCNTLTGTQVSRLLGENAKSNADLKATAGPTCTWKPPGNTNKQVVVNLFTTPPEGLSRIYRLHGTDLKFFMEVPPVEGHPAVAYGFTDTRNTKGECIVGVGTSDTSLLNTIITLSDANIGKMDPCAIAQEVAGEALANIKGGR
ncbi:DUF3558 domain-containing protein [Amycolatopsis sp. NPDC059021]|uniref:DUF3558 domain-containing protein n=1 Tax=Amycolatopsis sp. NPDC059021 TaxID=3346704 RepID=UPI00366EFB08